MAEVKLFNDNCIKAMEKIEESSIDLIVTDPPYNLGNFMKKRDTNYGKTGKYTGKGVFTIVEEASGQGASRWGRLKSGAGWISLDYAKRI